MTEDMFSEDDDLFSDSYVPVRKRTYSSIDQIEQAARRNTGGEQTSRWQKHTRKETRSGPETKVKSKVRDHLIKKYHAKVLRTNAGSIIDREGNTIYLGETGQSDLHAVVPIEIDGFTFGIFMAIETKAGKNVATAAQKVYLDQVRERGGVGCIAYGTEDVDAAIMGKVMEIQSKFVPRSDNLIEE